MNDFSHCHIDENGQPHQYFSPWWCPTGLTRIEYPQQPPEFQVPEPSSWALLVIAFVVLVLLRRVRA